MGAPMHEEKLRRFFEGVVEPAALQSDIQVSIRQYSRGSVREHSKIVDMSDDFTVKSAHLVMACDAFQDGFL